MGFLLDYSLTGSIITLAGGLQRTIKTERTLGLIEGTKNSHYFLLSFDFSALLRRNSLGSAISGR